MIKVREAFNNKKAFIGFVTACDPDLDTTKEIILSMQEGGADLIEIGIPFSDPVAEGTVIQAASYRALKDGCTTDKIFDMVESIKDQIKIPLVFMTYMNIVYKYGVDKFMKKCTQCGVSGIIIPDCPFEEKHELEPVCIANDIDLISLIAPTSKERIKEIASSAQGFVYIVSSMGVTGVRSEITTDIKSMVELVKQQKDIPCAVGFGISTPQQAAEMSKNADGVIVGSAIVNIVAEHGKESPKFVYDYVKSMKDAIK